MKQKKRQLEREKKKVFNGAFWLRDEELLWRKKIVIFQSSHSKGRTELCEICVKKNWTLMMLPK